MRPCLLIGVIAFIAGGVSSPLSRQEGVRAAGPDDTRKTIERYEKQLRDATLKNDAEATDLLLADDWLNVNTNGTVTDKKQLLRVIKEFKFESIKDDDVRIRVYGGSAVVTGSSVRVLPSPDGRSVTRKVRFTRVWTKKGDGWVVVTAQSTPITE